MRKQERLDASCAGRLLGWVAPLALAAYALCALKVWTDPEWRPEWDSALYILAEGRATASASTFVLRPPGFSWLISLVSDGPFDPAAATPAAVYFAFARSSSRSSLERAHRRGPELALALLWRSRRCDAGREARGDSHVGTLRRRRRRVCEATWSMHTTRPPVMPNMCGRRPPRHAARS